MPHLLCFWLAAVSQLHAPRSCDCCRPCLVSLHGQFRSLAACHWFGGSSHSCPDLGGVNSAAAVHIDCHSEGASSRQRRSEVSVQLCGLAWLDQMFSDAFNKDHQLIRADPKHSLYLACALMVRGNVHISDLRRNIERLKPSLQFVSWNQEGWKTSLCSVPPVGHTHSLLALANNTCVKPTFLDLRDRFIKLYRKKAHLHHYLQVDGMEQSCFMDAFSSLSNLIDEYNQLDASKGVAMSDPPRISIAV
ncbi:hypothetical protein GDO78_020444 [Eleutherodactylus coqui]|uniref:Tubulin/FtsZ 2-layer sandwich domain-containing protein n=1 Tax=Eleutherodactylus coqui TaxID=57060 RepID=A0A8J6BNZ6_ELECQ|nr:hypothetical protein GDO78_020444 [Eleutherodactylus coqui]